MLSRFVITAVALQAAAGGGNLKLTAIPAACAPAIQRASPLLAAGDSAITRRDARAAIARFDAALRALGEAYHRPALRDDTGMRLVLADDQERKGQFAKAALVKRRVLVERLQLCGASAK